MSWLKTETPRYLLPGNQPAPEIARPSAVEVLLRSLLKTPTPEYIEPAEDAPEMQGRAP
jgi:hypothetical protein